MRFVRRVILAGLAAATALAVAAAPRRAAAAPPPRWLALSDGIFQTLGSQEGLPNPVVDAIAQDPEGFLWVGTSDGVARWDGFRFRTYRASTTGANGLPDNFVRVLTADDHGTLWLGTATGGLASYNPQTDRFRTYRLAAAGQPATAGGRLDILAIAGDAAGGVWVGSGSGLYHLDAASPAATQPGASRAATRQAAAAPVLRRVADVALPGGRIFSLLLDRGGRLWAGTSHGLFRRDHAGQPFHQVMLPVAAASLPVVSTLLQDQAGRVWIGTAGAGAFVVAPDDQARQVQEPSSAPDRVQTLDVESLVEVRPGEIWLGTTGEGIVDVQADTLATTRIRHDPLRPTSLPDDTVWSLQQDRAGAVWVGTNRGLARFDPGQTGILTIFGGAGLRSGIADPDVMSVLAVPDGHVWLGLQAHDVAILDPGATANKPGALPHDARLPNAIVTALAQIPDAGVFIATWRGLFRTDYAMRQIEHIMLPEVPRGQAISNLTAIGQTLWIGTPDGLFRLDVGAGPNGPAPTNSQAGLPPPQIGVRRVPITAQLTDRRIRVIQPAQGGRLWIGTWDGLNLYDPATGEVRQLRADPADPSALSSGLITTTLLDRQGRLWVGTGGGGIDIISAPASAGGTPWRGDQPPVIRRIGTADGLPNPNVDKLLRAPDGNIWASTDDGLVRIDPTTLTVSALHLAEGVAISAYWADSGTVTPQGELLFGGTGGLTVVRPDHVADTRQSLSIAITDLRIGGKPVPAGALNSGRPAAPLIISPDANSLEVEFSALHFADPGRFRYLYWMQGVDHGWVETDAARRLAAYTNLPPGALTLMLCVADASGAQPPAVLQVPIRVLPAWYQTWWFIFGGLVSGIGTILLVLRLQSAWQRRREHVLERLIRERTAALSRSNEALTRAAATLSDLAEIGQQITASHDAEKILEALHDHVRRLLNAHTFAIFLVHGGPGPLLALRFGVRAGLRQPAGAPVEAWHTDAIAHALRDRREVVVEAPCRPPAPPGHTCHSVYAPLIVLDRVIGVMLIEYEDASELTERERMIVRTISAYGAIALDNAEILEALAQAQSRLEQLAFSDGLTNLPNRRVYIEQFERFRTQSIAECREFALLLIDLDRFKQINDTFGHDVGDAMLVETARRLQLAVRAGDVVMRLGGDEFAVLLGDVEGLQAVARVCRRIVESFRCDIHINGVDVQASTSIGVAIFPDDGDSVEMLYKAADIALYEAKRSGRNTWCKFEPSLVATDGQLE